MLRLHLPAVPDAVGAARREVSSWAERHGAAGTLLGDIALAISETCTNVLTHAYRDGADGTIHLFCRCDDGSLRITVTDDGVGMRPRPDSPGMGLGLPIVSQVVESVEVRRRPEGGTEVSMTFGLRSVA